MPSETIDPVALELLTIPDLAAAMAAGARIHRVAEVAPRATEIQPLPLIAGTDTFTEDWVGMWHSEVHQSPVHALGCYSAMDAVISGTGEVWLDGRLITAREIMHDYVAVGYDVAGGGNARLHAATRRPIRSIDTPCLVAVGHGIAVYGHFLTELLFRILVAQRALAATRLRYQVLLDQAAPEWLLTILTDDLGIPASSLVFFQPDIEQVRLRHAILPSRIYTEYRFHPAADEMLAELLGRLALPEPATSPSPRRIFVTRGKFHNLAAPHRVCINEQALIDIAVTRHGFTPVTVETMSWRAQIALFRDAEMVLGQAGSGLHNALFCQPGTRVASIGLMNLMQSMIGTLRGQHQAFMSNNFTLEGEFRVDEATFTTFLDRVCGVEAEIEPDVTPEPEPEPVVERLVTETLPVSKRGLWKRLFSG
jgi:capsular polysaccharide biosynthesis protein